MSIVESRHSRLIGKVDLVMWTKNGSRTLPFVLKRIDEVIPNNVVNQRILVDDDSMDDTCEIGKSFGWQVFFNEGKGISSGANTALSHVTSAFFISFEQDLLLARDWWEKIPRLLANGRIAVASGVRVPNQPVALKKLQEYITERYQRKAEKQADFYYAKTMDNTIYKTDIVRKIGGFPYLPVSVGVDVALAQRFFSYGYRWKVDYHVKSIHLRSGLKEELAHYYWYGLCSNKLTPIIFQKPADLKRNILRVFFSPVRGLHAAIKKNAPEAIYIYPLIRLNVLKGNLDGRRKLREDFLANKA